MAGREDARSLARYLAALGGGAEVVRLAAARRLGELHPVDRNEVLSELVALARSGHHAAVTALPHVMKALEREEPPIEPALQGRLAATQELPEVEALFPDEAPRRAMSPKAAAQRDARMFSESLGHQKQLARTTRDPDLLARLMVASNAQVVRNALLNPRLTEAHVVRIAARQPALPEPLIEIWRSTRWSCRHAVRRALVFNPYLPPAVGAKILPTLPGVDLEEVARQPSLHPQLRAQATELVEGPGGVRESSGGDEAGPGARGGGA